MKSEEKQSLAEDRTEWAEDRTVLANERTFAGWMRTGLGSLGMAVALQAVFGATEPTWLAKIAALIFVVISLIIFYLAWKTSAAMIEHLDAHCVELVSKNNMGKVSAVFSMGAIVVGLVLIIV